MAGDWSREENELTVSSYLDMLALELRGEDFTKADFWRALRDRIPLRTKGAIEFKYGNVSAVLRDLHFPSVEGYKPYSNYQADLFAVVERQLTERPDLTNFVAAQVEQPVAPMGFDDILAALVAKPNAPEPSRERAALAWYEKPIRTNPTDYLERESRNSSLGAAGEAFVLAFEQARLVAAGKESLAASVERVSVTHGPTAGFDIRSFEESGKDKLIEVKTTRYGPHTPFFITRNEVTTSDRYAEYYALYRLFAFERDRRLFILPGPVRANCSMNASLYEAVVL